MENIWKNNNTLLRFNERNEWSTEDYSSELAKYLVEKGWETVDVTSYRDDKRTVADLCDSLDGIQADNDKFIVTVGNFNNFVKILVARLEDDTFVYGIFTDWHNEGFVLEDEGNSYDLWMLINAICNCINVLEDDGYFDQGVERDWD